MSDRVVEITTVTTHTQSRAWAYVELSKMRIASLVLMATAVGFYLAWSGPLTTRAMVLLFHAVLGTGLVAAGANAMNQYLEVQYDQLMARTQSRPLPAGRLTPIEVLTFSIGTVLLGVVYLSAYVNPTCATLAALTYIIYVFFYTPLKRVTSMSVMVGAIPGALPPVIGWAAVGNPLSIEAWLLFGIVFFWQMPHFAAIAWQYREDYAKAGFPVLAVIDPEGTRIKLHVVTHTVGMISASLLPALYGVTGMMYAVAAMLLGVMFLISGLRFVSKKTTRAARSHVIASIIYLPLLLIVMMIDKV